MQHYYNDDGILNYELDNEEIIDRFISAFKAELSNCRDGLAKGNALIYGFSQDLVYNYNLHASIGGSMGGCLTTDEWKLVIPECPMEAVIKEIMYDFAEKGFVPSELSLATLGLFHSLAFNFIVS